MNSNSIKASFGEKMAIAITALILVIILLVLSAVTSPSSHSKNAASKSQKEATNSTEEEKDAVLSETKTTKEKEKTLKKETKEKPKTSNSSNTITKVTAKNFHENSLKLEENQIAISFKNGDYWIIHCYKDYFESQAKPISLSHEMGVNSEQKNIDLDSYIYGFMSQQIDQNNNFSILEDFNGWKNVKILNYSELSSCFVLIAPNISSFCDDDTVKHFRFKTKNKGKYYYFSLCFIVYSINVMY